MSESQTINDPQTHQLILFDIDGTLSLSSGLGGKAMLEAGQHRYGDHFTLEGISFAGSLDPAVYQRFCEINQIQPSEADEAAFMRDYFMTFERMINQAADQIQALPGARALVDALSKCPDMTLGLLTGNYTQSAWMKVQAAGFDRFLFEIHAFADQFHCRRELAANALNLFHVHHQDTLPDPNVIVIGDTPKDIDCAKANGYQCIAVATGNYAMNDLLEHSPDLCVADLSETQSIMQWILNQRSTS